MVRGMFSRVHFSGPPPVLAVLCLALPACAPHGEAQTGKTQITQTQTAQVQTAPATQTLTPQRDAHSGLLFVARSALPTQAQRTLSLIERGGPFPYQKDGVTFGNREGILPGQRGGYYHEYTVTTPGSSDRGARRIVCGPPRNSSKECYYTSDHYASFRRIEP